MCEVVNIDEKVETQMKKLYPKEISKEYFDIFAELTIQETLKNKNEREHERTWLFGKDGLHDIFKATFTDVLTARQRLMDIIN